MGLYETVQESVQVVQGKEPASRQFLLIKSTCNYYAYHYEGTGQKNPCFTFDLKRNLGLAADTIQR